MPLQLYLIIILMAFKLNQPAPEFTLPDLVGRIHMLGDYRGRIVIVNFWSAECPHSERFDADITANLAQWGQDVVLLSVASNANEPDGLLAAVARQRGIPVVLRDADRSVADRYEALTRASCVIAARWTMSPFENANHPDSF